MSNIINYPGLKSFKSGSQWSGNRSGRPKKTYHRDDFTNELFLERKEDIRVVTEKLFIQAKAEMPWAIKLVFEYFLTRPKNSDTEDDSMNHIDLVERLKEIPNTKLIAIHKILSEESE